MWLVLLEAERIRNRITLSDKSFALPKSVFTATFGTLIGMLFH